MCTLHRTFSHSVEQTGVYIWLEHLQSMIRRTFLPYRLIVHYEEILYTKVTVYFGLHTRCALTVSEIPGPSGEGKISYRNYECRPFPSSVTDRCEKENKAFCAAWTSAGYLDQISMGFAGVSLLAILFGISTHSRRRRIWRAVAGLVMLQGNAHAISSVLLVLLKTLLLQLPVKSLPLRLLQKCIALTAILHLSAHVQVRTLQCLGFLSSSRWLL